MRKIRQEVATLDYNEITKIEETFSEMIIFGQPFLEGEINKLKKDEILLSKLSTSSALVIKLNIFHSSFVFMGFNCSTFD